MDLGVGNIGRIQTDETKPKKKRNRRAKNKTEENTILVSSNALQKEVVTPNAAIDSAKRFGMISTGIVMTTGLTLGYLIKKYTEAQTFSSPISGAFLGAAVGGALAVRYKKLGEDKQCPNPSRDANIAALTGAVVTGMRFGAAILGVHLTSGRLSNLKIDFSNLLSSQSFETISNLTFEQKCQNLFIAPVIGTGFGCVAGISAVFAGVAISGIVTGALPKKKFGQSD